MKNQSKHEELAIAKDRLKNDGDSMSPDTMRAINQRIAILEKELYPKQVEMESQQRSDNAKRVHAAIVRCTKTIKEIIGKNVVVSYELSGEVLTMPDEIRDKVIERVTVTVLEVCKVKKHQLTNRKKVDMDAKYLWTYFLKQKLNPSADQKIADILKIERSSVISRLNKLMELLAIDRRLAAQFNEIQKSLLDLKYHEQYLY